MLGLMQDWPLTVDKIIDHANLNYSNREIVSRSVEGPILRSNYAQVHSRSKKLSNWLKSQNLRFGSRVASLAWNSGRHMECWYGAMGIGLVLHTLNPRLFADQLIYIIKHAEDEIIFSDISFAPLLEQIIPLCPSVKAVVYLTDKSNMPATKLANVHCYEEILDHENDECQWGGFDENTACGLCYTSGTTGNPKGVLYSHRSNVLHSYMSLTADVMGISSSDVVLPVVPMFHANTWGVIFSAPMVGAKIVMPGAKMDGSSIYELLETEKVNFTAAVPTVWLMLLQYLESTNQKLNSLKRVVIGGAALPERILRTFEDKYGIEVRHAWGMTETSPLGTVCTLTPEAMELSKDEQIAIKLKQGRSPFGVELKICRDGESAPRDGSTFGNLMVRGPAIAKSYFKNEGGEILDEEGYFDTGDVANIDPHGYMQITDRSKDVIKSGGEWISSIDIENIAVGVDGVAIAAVIGHYHPKWDERPLLVIQTKENFEVSKEEVLGYLNGKIAKWWMPDDVQFIDAIPLGATGKINKVSLREMFKDYEFPK